uniref:NADH dehydrogenase subunit 6 n=1 Tax=Knipowitschia caucasica TaxID=637954 RepID=A0AAV2MMH5_KNICA
MGGCGVCGLVCVMWVVVFGLLGCLSVVVVGWVLGGGCWFGGGVLGVLSLCWVVVCGVGLWGGFGCVGGWVLVLWECGGGLGGGVGGWVVGGGGVSGGW